MWLNAGSLSGPTQVNVSKGWSGAKCRPGKTVFGCRSSALGKNPSSMAFADDQRPKTNDV
jgi:hypothetical protein